MDKENIQNQDDSFFDIPLPGDDRPAEPDLPLAPDPTAPSNAASQDDGWFDEILGKPTAPAPEIDMDENAVHGAGLTHPADMELERIIEETKNMDDAPVDLPENPVEDDNAEDPPYAFTPEDEGDDPLPFDPEDEPADDPAPKKRRPGWKKGSGLLGIPHILVTAVWLFIIVAVGVSLGRLLWICATDVLAFGKPVKEAIITINEDDTAEEIANKLEKAGMIEYPGLFALYLKFSGNDELITGTHQFTPMIYDYHAIKTALEPKTTARDVVEVVIPEGYTCAQIFELLEKKGVCTVAKLEDYAANGALNDYWFLEGVERGDKYCLEGYLFPDTYQFYKGHDPELVLEKMLDNFDYRFTDIMKDKIDVLNDRIAKTLRSRGYDESFIASRKFTIREVVIVASMIERETANGTESYDIASVIYNRLTNPGNYPFLNIDATVIYGMGGAKIDPETGDSLPLTAEDLATDTPYNTYTRKGLIPGPISNPGRNSLNAALDPNDTGYYFYVFDPSIGEHRFAHNEAEHEQNKARVKN